jgi:hypothetical protein
MKLDLIRDILDKQLIDRHCSPMGRADGVVIVIRDGEQPEFDHLQLGATILARRLHPRAERVVEWFRRRWPVRQEAVQVVRWPQIAEITSHDIKVDLEAEETPAMDWERWLRDHVVSRIPGSSK